MIAFAPTIARLKAAGFGHVEGVLEFLGLEQAPRVSPALFLVPERESAQPNRLGAGGHDQKITEVFSVILIVNSTRKAGDTSEVLQEHVKNIEDAIIGWKHPDASGACEYISARLMSVEAHRIAWAISFSVSRHFRKVSQ